MNGGPDMEDWKRDPDPLPDRLSDLLNLAAGDLEKAERDPETLVDMASWHAALPGGCAAEDGKMRRGGC